MITLLYGVYFITHNDEIKPLDSVTEYRNNIRLDTRRTNKTSIFAVDYIPTEYRNVTVLKGTVHFCIIAAKSKTADELRILLKSVLIHARRSNVFFHVVLYEGAENNVPDIFYELSCAFTNLRYEFIYVDLQKYLMNMFHYRVTNTNPHSRMYGLAKLFLFQIMSHLDQCLVIDTDIIFSVDPIFLWNDMVSKLTTGFAIAAAENNLNVKTSFNSGMLLQNFALMRRLNFTRFYELDELCRKVMEHEFFYYQCGGDQAILDGIYKRHRSLFIFFSNSWNLIRCENFYNFDFSSNNQKDLFFGGVHFTCMPLKYTSAFEAFVIFSSKTRKYQLLRDYIIFLQEIAFLNHQEVACNSSKNTIQNITL